MMAAGQAIAMKEGNGFARAFSRAPAALSLNGLLLLSRP
jgi:hypothetical protein